MKRHETHLPSRPGPITWWLVGGRPDLVLLHGFTDDADCWAPLLPDLAEFGGVLAVDARGHGGSAVPPGPVGPGPQASDVAAVLDPLTTRPVVVLGHSMGAVTAARLAADRPDLVAALVLEDPPPGAFADDGARGVPDWLAGVRGRPHAERVAAAGRENPLWPADELEPWAASKAAFDLDYCRRPTEPSPPLAAVLGGTTCPVLLLCGAPELGGMVGAGDVAAMREACGPRLSVARFDRAGHSVRRDDREGYLRELRAWIPGHAGAAGAVSVTDAVSASQLPENNGEA